mmetsp:Transcript_26705/g.54685  ORF Transcript_26705/g.54685 Transcript_26705/m.54685 type:complete len:137 (-) Transcript_26705:294-704(-)
MHLDGSALIWPKVVVSFCVLKTKWKSLRFMHLLTGVPPPMRLDAESFFAPTQEFWLQLFDGGCGSGPREGQVAREDGAEGAEEPRHHKEREGGAVARGKRGEAFDAGNSGNPEERGTTNLDEGNQRTEEEGRGLYQ